ncbi:MAG: hypothetical protein ISS74_06650 [Planctomycetes bacterium]|nr:hypothetical protein [Planctomycetota bacterium]
MRRLLIIAGVVGLVLVLALGPMALAGKQKRGGDRDRIRDCAQVVSPRLTPCADQQRDKDRDQDRDGDQQQDRDRDRLCDCGNYVDMDGDGFCDNCDCPGMPQDGTGRQYRGGR